jgi:hypothetical protein
VFEPALALNLLLVLGSFEQGYLLLSISSVRVINRYRLAQMASTP